MIDDESPFAEDDDFGPGLSVHQKIVDGLLDKYNAGIEPLENWTNSDLVQLSSCINAELQSRVVDPDDQYIYIELDAELTYDGEDDAA